MDDVQAFSQPSAEISANQESEQAPVSQEALNAFLKYLEDNCDVTRDSIVDRETGKIHTYKSIRSFFKTVTKEPYYLGAKALLMKSIYHLKGHKKKSKSSKSDYADAGDKLTPNQAKDIAEEAVNELIFGILRHFFAFAPISTGNNSMNAYYQKTQVQLADGSWTITYQRLCFETTQMSSIIPDICRACNRLGIGKDIKAFHKNYAKRLGSWSQLLGNEWTNLVEKAFKLLQQGDEVWGNSFRLEPIAPLKDVDAERASGQDIPGCFLPGPILVPHCKEWNALLERCSDPLMFCVWFARLFDPRDSGRQALVLRGPGQTGTSVLINALNVLMGDLSKAEPQTENQFTAPMLAGARLITVSDVADRYYLMQQRFKQRTGGDVVRGELKYGSSGDVVIFSKVIVTTNQRLYLNPLQRWSTSRAIVLDFQGIEKTKIRPKEEVIRNLVEQFPFFLSRARLVNDSYTQVFKSNPVDIPLTYTTMLRMRRGWERNGSILYRWIHTNVEEASGEPRAVLLPGCDGTDDSHYMVENFLSEDELLKPITELLKKVPDAKKEERIINLLHEVKSYISEVFHIEELNESYRAQDGSTVTVVGFPGLKLKADTLEIRKLPPFVFDETLSAAPRAPIYSSPVDGIYLGEYVAGFAPKSKKKGVTKNVLDSIF